MFKDKFFGSPIFISGWVKSGTGIFLRLFDNHKNIHCPHGEGKLGIVYPTSKRTKCVISYT